jgi:hypothetical protein
MLVCIIIFVREQVRTIPPPSPNAALATATAHLSSKEGAKKEHLASSTWDDAFVLARMIAHCIAAHMGRQARALSYPTHEPLLVCAEPTLPEFGKFMHGNPGAGVDGPKAGGGAVIEMLFRAVMY